MASGQISVSLRSVLDRVSNACKARPLELQKQEARLVAVSKTKPIPLIIEAYKCGQRNFGENYVQELEEKSKDPEILQSCPDINWHFIGLLQSNKINKVLGSPNLYMLETIHSKKLATAVNKSWEKLAKKFKLNVMVQVNTSREENKSGCLPEEALSLVTYVLNQCPQLNLAGLMTIGAFDHDLSKGPNPDFQTLIKCREDVCKALSMNPWELELSMGMSNDFEHAIEVGSTNVRVGSTIFGAREMKKKQDATDSTKHQMAAPSTNGAVDNVTIAMNKLKS